MSTYQANNTTTTTDYSDGTQVKTTDFTKKTNLATENTDLSKPEFEYSKPVPTTLNTTHTTTTSTNPSMTTYDSTGASKTDQLKNKVSQIGHSIESAVNSASQHLNDAVAHRSTPATTTASQTQYNTVTPATTTATGEIHSTNIHQQPPHQKSGLGAKLNDMMSHVGAALHSGHPIHAVTNAGTAVKVGECERIKHERGPIVDESAGTSHASSLDNPSFNAAGQPYENQSSAALHHPTTHTFNESTYNHPSTTTGTTTYGQSAYNQPITGNTSAYGSTTDHSNYTTGDKIRDMASHASAQLSHGNPITAVTDAPAAARIAEAEKMKHAKGPIETTNMQSNQSIGGATGISGQGGASSTLSQSDIHQQHRNY